jgi:protease-4
VALLGALSVGCDARETPKTLPTPTVDELREFVIDGPAPEETTGELLGDTHSSHRELLDQLADVIKQPKVKGVFLRLSSFGGAWARGTELHDALQSVRESKKPVHCYFDNADNSGYALLAGSCDRISMAPAGLLALTGVQAQVIYARDLLDTLGLQAELLQVGRFKGAADALTRSDMPSEVREVLNQLVDDLQASLAAAVMAGRSLDAASFTKALDEGPHAPKAALAHHLVDAIAFDDEARAKAKAAASAQRVVRVPHGQSSGKVDLSDLFKMLWRGERSKPKGDRIALAYLDGTIRDEERDQGAGSTSGPFVAGMRRVADDKEIRALVLRIDSPGGSALASDKMWHAVRRVAKRKPVIVSIGDMAASGGYYVACAGTEIFADDQSVVGSIGVVGGKIVAEKLAERAGVRSVSLGRGQNAGWSSPFKPFSDSERRAVLLAMNDTYDTFLARVREGRKLETSRLSAVAEGRIMTGKRARAGGLVDSMGGLTQALARARSKAGLAADAPLEVWHKEPSVVGLVSQLVSGASSASPLQTSLSALPDFLRSPVVLALLNRDAGPLTVLPYGLQLN